jgi:Kef-type K+ transport system membrane component KefB
MVLKGGRACGLSRLETGQNRRDNCAELLNQAVSNLHPAFWVMAAAVLAPLLAELRVGFAVPVVVFEVLLGVALGPHGLGFIKFEGFMVPMYALGMAATLFMAGMELDFKEIRGTPLWLALRGWGVSLLVGMAAVALLYATPLANAPMMLTLALCTTALGTLLPMLRDAGQLQSRFGRLFLAVGTVGEVGPIVAMSLLLSQEYSTWQEFGLLLLFLALVAVTAATGMGLRPARVVALLSRTLHASTQLPVRLALFIMAGFFVLTEEFGFENILGAFAAGMVVGLATRDNKAKPLRHKIDALCFGWFTPFFFVGTGAKLHLSAITQNLETALMVPVFMLVLLAVRGLPVLAYGAQLARGERLPFALYSSVASLSLVAVITDIGVRKHSIGTHLAAALVGAALLSVLVFPTLAGALLAKAAAARVEKPASGSGP